METWHGNPITTIVWRRGTIRHPAAIPVAASLVAPILGVVQRGQDIAAERAAINAEPVHDADWWARHLANDADPGRFYRIERHIYEGGDVLRLWLQSYPARHADIGGADARLLIPLIQSLPIRPDGTVDRMVGFLGQRIAVILDSDGAPQVVISTGWI